MRTLFIILLFTSVHASADFVGSALHGFAIGSGPIAPQGEVYPREMLESIAVLENKFSANEHTRLVLSFETFKSNADKYYLNVRFCVKGRTRRTCFHEATRTVYFTPDRTGLLLRDIYLSNLSKKTLENMAPHLKDNKLEVLAVLKKVKGWYYLDDEIVSETQFDFLPALQSGEFITVHKIDRELTVGIQFQN